MSKDGFRDDFRRSFLAGVATLFPILFTLFLFVWLYRQIDSTIGESTIRLLSRKATFAAVFKSAPPETVNDPAARRAYAEQRFPRFVVVLLGLGVVIIAIYLLGRVLRGYLGRRAFTMVDGFFERFPVVKAIYPHAREVGNFLFGVSEKPRFSRVVAVQYPRLGVFSLGLVTGEGLNDIGERVRRGLVTVFIPTSPTPLTGFIIVVPRDEVISMDMTIDEAFRYCVTAGMLAPTRQQPGAEQQTETAPASGAAGVDVPRLPEVGERSDGAQGSQGAAGGPGGDSGSAEGET